MKEQSLEFIIGYVFSKIEKKVYETHINKLPKTEAIEISIPKTWFGLRAIKDKNEDIDCFAKCILITSIKQLCLAYNTEKSKYDFTMTIEPDEQYILITIEGKRTSPKEMTVAEIEKELGYKIKIVNEETNTDRRY
jgi:hypothetical protein